MKLSTPRLTLREFWQSDFATFRTLEAHPETYRYESAGPDEVATHNDLESAIADVRQAPHTRYRFAVTTGTENEIWGRVRLALGRKVTAYRAGAVPGTDFTRIDGIVAEVQAVAPQQPSANIAVLVADQCLTEDGQVVVGHHIGVEVDLDLGIQRNHLQGGGQVFDEELLGLVQIIYVGVAAVAIVGQLLHQHII